MSRAIIAILRGVRPDEIDPIAEALLDAGITRIEVPLNSPDPLDSIERLVKNFAGRGIFGAGTVLDPGAVADVAAVGGQMIVSPDCCAEVIRDTKARGLKSYPGVATATECFAALRAGADGLKLFPAFAIGTAGLAALKAVLPSGTETYAVGGVGADNFAAWQAAGVTGFGIGSGIYKPGMDAALVRARADELVAAYDAVFT